MEGVGISGPSVKGNQWGIGSNTAGVGGMRTGSVGFADADAVVISNKCKERPVLVREKISFFMLLDLGQGGVPAHCGGSKRAPVDMMRPQTRFRCVRVLS